MKLEYSSSSIKILEILDIKILELEYGTRVPTRVLEYLFEQLLELE
jgi:hypothetical protein